MTLAESLGFFNQIVTVTPRSGYSGGGYGQPSYGTDYVLFARVEYASEQVRAPSGDEVTSRARVYVGGDPGLDFEDEVTLPDGKTYPIVTIERQPDENGSIDHTVIVL